MVQRRFSANFPVFHIQQVNNRHVNKQFLCVRKRILPSTTNSKSIELCHENGVISVYEPQREKTYLLTCAPNKDSDQTARMRSLIRVFVVCIEQPTTLAIPKAPSEILIRLRKIAC